MAGPQRIRSRRWSIETNPFLEDHHGPPRDLVREVRCPHGFNAPGVDAQQDRPGPAKARRDAGGRVSAARGLLLLGRRTTWLLLCSASDGDPTPQPESRPSAWLAWGAPTKTEPRRYPANELRCVGNSAVEGIHRDSIVRTRNDNFVVTLNHRRRIRIRAPRRYKRRPAGASHGHP